MSFCQFFSSAKERIATVWSQSPRRHTYAMMPVALMQVLSAHYWMLLPYTRLSTDAEESSALKDIVLVTLVLSSFVMAGTLAYVADLLREKKETVLFVQPTAYPLLKWSPVVAGVLFSVAQNYWIFDEKQKILSTESGASVDATSNFFGKNAILLSQVFYYAYRGLLTGLCAESVKQLSESPVVSRTGLL